jgi:hypothetical protein
MVLNGFVGPAYVSTSRNAAVETLYNWNPQSIEVPTEPARIIYIPRPGKSVFCTLPATPVRCLFQQDGRMFGVGGQVLYEIDTNGAITVRGTLTASDTSPATINSSGTAGHQLYITSGGKGDIFDLNANTLTSIVAAGYPPATPMGTYLDTYFLTIKGNSAQFNISGLLDGTAWAALDFAVRIQASDNLVGIMQYNKLIWLIGSQTSEPWYDSGNASFPYQSVPQVLIPMGCCAPFSIMRNSQAICWLHQSERGRGIYVAASDYNPKRISTYAVESIWATYPIISDCVAYGMTWQGHEYIVLTFPSGNATWVYDLGEQLWTNWSWWNLNTANQDRDRGWVHCQGFGQHFVGDWENGNVYKLDDALSTDNGASIVWERTSPHLNNQKKMMFYGNAELDMETGLGGTYPTAHLNWSDDGGHTYSTPIDMSTGAPGQYQTRCRVAGNLGSSRDRAFRVRISNTVPSRLLQFYMDISQGTN